MVGPPPPGPDDEQAGDDADVGPSLPKAKKRKVRLLPPMTAGQTMLAVMGCSEALCPSLGENVGYASTDPCRSCVPLALQTLDFEQQYLDALPSANMYEKSYMHRDTVNNVAVTCTDFIITTSVDGVLKFWKKQTTGIEFVKQYRAHVGSVDGEGAALPSVQSW